MDLISLSPLDCASELTVSTPLTPSADAAVYPTLATFDGGARCVDGCFNSGAGATLWAAQPNAAPRCVAMAFLAEPLSANAQLAEARGGQLVMNLLRTLCKRKTARVAGDNLQVIRYCAGSARLHATHLHEHLNRGLSDLAICGWTILWHAVRRSLNKAADECATAAVHWAAWRHAHNQDQIVIHVHRRDEDHTLPDGLHIPGWPDAD